MLLGVLTRALEMFWSMKKSNESEKPRPAEAKTAPTGSVARGATSNMPSLGL